LEVIIHSLDNIVHVIFIYGMMLVVVLVLVLVLG
jgi:hypothetical protein